MKHLNTYIIESLKSYDGQKLADKLQTLYPEFDIYYNIERHCIDIMNLHHPTSSTIPLLSDKKFLQLLDLYGWQISGQEEFNERGIQSSQMELEPRNNDDVTDWVFKKCGGICYHFTDKENVTKILQSGLRPKNTYSTSYYKKNNNAESRLYMLATTTPNSLSVEDLRLLDEQADIKGYITNWGCIKIDLHKISHISLFEDHNTVWERKDRDKSRAVYCNTFIPAKCLEKYDIYSITKGKSTKKYLYDELDKMMRDFRKQNP